VENSENRLVVYYNKKASTALLDNIVKGLIEGSRKLEVMLSSSESLSLPCELEETREFSRIVCYMTSIEVESRSVEPTDLAYFFKIVAGMLKTQPKLEDVSLEEKKDTKIKTRILKKK